ncbi:multiple monosaccharide ABC transporter substrate-binding protein [Cellulomonas sp. SG140]|uniref:multiple monosaccharide ABC transporter substrate-binding protein n=1 Tax=Cellulomonas sp. SG140 TaxID=2976536 RepID=UPI0021E816A4|nr:multiple monosaccharide ABC transporter substrate-binding protein [Cellulomonas sp. SG140]
MHLKRIAAIAAAFTLSLTMAACSGGGAGSTSGSTSGSTAAAGGAATKGDLIGVAMPTKSSERWINDGNNVKSQLEALGYKVDLQYAEDDIPTQVNQIDTMITKGAKVLIIASIDGTALTSQLEQAHSNGIKVIAYDRLIRNSANVDYYTTFDNFKVGVQQATSLLTGLGILDASGKDTGKTGPLNIELFAGSPDDNNATFFYNGAMSILKPYIDKKVLVVKSGQTDFKTIATLRWDPATAQSRMENLLTSTYADGSKVAGVLSPYDGLSIGILGALKGVGYGTASQPYPVVTGQDAEAASVKSIIKGEQYSTIYKDTRELAKVTVAMTDAILKGQEPKVTDTKTYDNGVKVVPSYLLESQIITKDNYKKVLVDGGYYTEAQLS